MPDRLSGYSLVVACGHDLSVALLHDGTLLAADHAEISRGHAEAIVPCIAALLDPFGGHSLRCRRVIVETGPGSFTGLRVGLAAGTALALAWGADLLGVRSTQLVAAEVRAAGHGQALLVALGAPRGQVWIEGFAADGIESLGPPEALSPPEAAARASEFPLLAGTAACVRDALGVSVPPRASAASSLSSADFGSAELLYVRAAEPVLAA